MGIFRRVSDILTANVNDLLDRAENPEKMIKQVIREMEEAVQGARRNVAQVMANQKKLEKELQTNKRLVDEWQRKAEQAVEMDSDDLARKALTRKREYGNLVGSLEQQYEAGQGTVDGLRQTLRGLEAKLADAKRRKATLIARKRTAEAEIAAENHLARAARGAKAATSFAKFEHFEEQVDDLEAEAGALREMTAAEAEVQAEFEELEEETDVEIELEELKQKAKKAKGDKQD